MCGFAGLLFNPAEPGREIDPQSRVERMSATLVHRGPDDHGLWLDCAAGIGLGHRRLAVLDRTPEGRQPMMSACGRYVIVYNGEIYNFIELRHELARAGHAFRGHSDTEVLLAAVAHWGIDDALRRCQGMFAFALWDRTDQVLRLARDRIGKKPLYYGRIGDAFGFASELKAFRAHPEFDAEIDRGALTLFLRLGYVPAPYSIYRGIQKLTPGCVLTLAGDHPRRDRASRDGSLQPVPFWSAQSIAEEGTREPFRGTDAQAIDGLDGLLRDAVRARMHADVPIGAFLSGGIDSSVVTAMMQAQSSRAVRTFSIGFHRHRYDEARHAKAVAQRLGTEHTELYLDDADARAVVPRLPHIFDEPFADSSQIPTFLVSRMTREHVTVALSGDGGDELFFGYRRYLRALKVWRALQAVPVALRRPLASLLRACRAKRLSDIGDELRATRPEAVYRHRVSRWRDPARVVLNGTQPPTVFSDAAERPLDLDAAQSMMYIDLVTYLPDDILVKVDRASMATSLEARTPLLDHRVVEFAWRLPLNYKLRDGEGKWILRQVLARYLPDRLITRRKVGFGAPVDAWLRGPLREWAESLLVEGKLKSEGYFDPRPIRRMWADYQSGRGKWQHHLWHVLMFQAWLEA